MEVLSVPSVVHGRILIEGPSDSTRLLVGCHGYGQNAGLMLEELRRIPGADAWRLVAVQALHRFYTRNDQVVVASWMTREDRELAIADNVQYLNRAVDAAIGDATFDTAAGDRLVFLGFSQGASMAARAAVCGARRASGLIILGGDIPPDVREHVFATWPPVLIGCGDRDEWYGSRVESDIAFLRDRGVPHDVVRFAGGHEFTDEFRSAVGSWLAQRIAPFEL